MDRTPLDPHLFDGVVVHPDGATERVSRADSDDTMVHDYHSDARTQGPLVPEEIAARMRWAGSYVLPGVPQLTSFWAAVIRVEGRWTNDEGTRDYQPHAMPAGLVVLENVLIDNSEYQMQQRQGAQMPVLVTRRRTWRRELHLYGAVLLWVEISSKQREQARG